MRGLKCFRRGGTPREGGRTPHGVRGLKLLHVMPFYAGTAEIKKLADGDLSRTNVFAKNAIRQILKLSMSELPMKMTIPFELEMEKTRYGS